MHSCLTHPCHLLTVVVGPSTGAQWFIAIIPATRGLPPAPPSTLIRLIFASGANSLVAIDLWGWCYVHVHSRGGFTATSISFAYPLMLFPASWKIVSCWLPLPSMQVGAFIKGKLQKSILPSVLPSFLNTKQRPKLLARLATEGTEGTERKNGSGKAEKL